MRNLKLVDKVKHQLKSLDNIKCVLADQNNEKHQLILRTETDIHLYNCNDDVSKELVTNPTLIVDWEYLALNNEICLARDDGEVIVMNLSNDNFESVTFCEGGIERMCWSSDQEVVVFVTAAKNVVVMNCTYDPIAESSLEDEAFGDQEFITVGWGKKETQFHGTAGKEAAKKKSDFTPVEDLSTLNSSVAISWRGDGEYFAVSYLASYGRTFKIYNKEGLLQFTAEKLNNLGEAIAWRPSGNWIAVPHNFPNKYTIGLFEKNGLRHREIVLPFKQDDEPIVNLSWSNDSDILAIETIKDGKSNVYLFTIGNYHWYLKQSLNFDKKINDMRWDSGLNETKTLHLVMEDGMYLKYRWTFEVCYTIGNTMANLCIASVIDGKQLLLTDFRNNVIPPPMSKLILECENNINVTGFINDTESPRKLFVVTSNGNLLIYSIETQLNNVRAGDRLTAVTPLKEYSLIEDSSTDLPLNYNHCIWLDDETFVFCDSNSKKSTIFLFDLNTGSKSSISIPDQIVATAPVTKTSFLIHAISGDISMVAVQDNELTIPDLIVTLPDFCEHLQVITINGSIKSIALKDNQDLYIDDSKVTTGVTSFFIGEHYFAYTQLTTMKFMRLDKLRNMPVVSERRIERGAKIVTIVPKDSVTVLQMPRGNLEAVHPRVLSLQIVGELLDGLEYARAMILLRKQRINLNIIFDHNPKMFISNIESFLSEITNPHWLNLFLTELENEDYTQTKYASNYEEGRVDYPDGFKIEDKVSFVCDYLCNIMRSRNDERFIQPIITAYVKKAEFENALDLIWQLRKEEMKTSEPEKPRYAVTENPIRSKSDDALRYLLYMSDVDELYNIALGMYNTQLVIFVANKSHKDPKEYLPFLAELDALEENYKKFRIDDHLKRYEKAFQNIASCGKDKYNECLSYIEKYSLYTIALARFENDDREFYSKIALSFADYLRIAGKIENAGIMYERGGDLKQAIVSAKHVLDVDRCLMIAKSSNYNEEEMKSLALSLVPGLQANSRCDDAFDLLKKYGESFTEALNVLLEGRHYLKAIFETRSQDDNLIDTMVKPHLASSAQILQSSIEADKEKFLKHTIRLNIVRVEKAKKSTDDDYVDEGDLISEATSVTSKYTGTSRSSGKTFRSSKNRRKHERKLLNLKEGSKFEDIALIDALYKLIQHIFDQQQHIHDICKALIEVQLDSNGRLIQKAFGNLLKTVKDKLDEIWIPELMNNQQTILTSNLDYAQVQNEQHYAMIPPQQRFKPQLNLIDWEHAILM